MDAAPAVKSIKKSPFVCFADCLKNLVSHGCDKLKIKEIAPEKLRQESYSAIQRKVSDGIEMSALWQLPAAHTRAAKVHDAFIVHSASGESLSRDLASRTIAKISIGDLMTGKLALFRTAELSSNSAKTIAQEVSAHIYRLNGILENPAESHQTKALRVANDSFLTTLANHGLRLCIKHKQGFLIKLTEDEKLARDLSLTSVKLTQDISVRLISILSDDLSYLFSK